MTLFLKQCLLRVEKPDDKHARAECLQTLWSEDDQELLTVQHEHHGEEK